MLIDCDTHFLPRSWLDRVDPALVAGAIAIEWNGGDGAFYRHGRRVMNFEESVWNLEKRIPSMQQDGFDLQVLIPENRPLIYETERDLGCALARAYNDAAAEDLKAGGPFYGVAWVYLPDTEEAIAEMARAATVLGLKAVKLMGGYDSVHLGSPELQPFYAKAAELDIPLLLHPPARTYDDQPINPLLAGASSFPPEYWFLSSAYGFPFTYMVAIANLIFSGAMDRFPTLRFGFFEAGAEWVPYAMDRLDVYYDDHYRRGTEVVTRLKHTPSEYFSRFYVAVLSRERRLPALLQQLPDHRLIVGSDFPHQDPSGTWPNTLAELRAMDGFAPGDLDAMLDANPRSFLGL